MTSRKLLLRLCVPSLVMAIILSGCTPHAEKKWTESNEQFLDRYMKQPDIDMRRQAMIMVAETPDASKPWAQEVFQMEMESPDALMRQAALFGLFKAEQLSVPVLVDRLNNDKSQFVRQDAARYLTRLAEAGRIPTENMAEVEDAALAGSRIAANDADTQAACIQLLGFIRDRKVLDKLIDILDEQNFLLQACAERALVRLTGQEFAYDQAAWKEWLAKTPDPFAKGGYLPPSRSKRELNAVEKVFIQYRFQDPNWK